jgi:hypothetical protein
LSNISSSASMASDTPASSASSVDTDTGVLHPSLVLAAPASSSAGGWAEVEADCLVASQDDDDLIEQADACRTSSDEEDADKFFTPEEPPDDDDELWWVKLIKASTKPTSTTVVGAEHPRKLMLLSACTGCCAEGHVLEALFFF